MMIDNRTKVKIIKDYSFTIKGDPSAPIGQIGGSSREDITFSFKVGQIVEGYIYHSKKEIQVRFGNYLVPIPKENWELVNKEQNVVNQPVESISIGQASIQKESVSDLEYYTSANFLKRASVSIVPVGLIGAYCYHKKFSLLKSALLVSIPIVAITGLQYAVMGGGKNSYWGIFVPPSMKTNSIKQIK